MLLCSFTFTFEKIIKVVTKHFYLDQDTFVTQSAGYRTRLGYRFPIGNNVHRCFSGTSSQKSEIFSVC